MKKILKKEWLKYTLLLISIFIIGIYTGFKILGINVFKDIWKYSLAHTYWHNIYPYNSKGEKTCIVQTDEEFEYRLFVYVRPLFNIDSNTYEEIEEQTAIIEISNTLEIINVDNEKAEIEENTITLNFTKDDFEKYDDNLILVKIQVKVKETNEDLINTSSKIISKYNDKEYIETIESIPTYINNPIHIEKTPSKTEIFKGETFSFNINITNQTEYYINSMSITDTYDENLEILEIVNDDYYEPYKNYDKNNNIDWNFSLEPKESMNYNVIVKAKDNTTLTNNPISFNIDYALDYLYSCDDTASINSELLIKDIENPKTGVETNILKYVIIIIVGLLTIISIYFLKKKSNFHKI